MKAIRTKLGKGGRVIIPTAFRQNLHLETGDDIILAQRNGTCKKRNHWLVSLILTILRGNKFSYAPSFPLIYLFLCNLNNLQS
jgi:bifunctional DNA-binding transcriptional regulator/antitoxin component of YhaV-PrlF toxin-antitoxin module